ncbi:MAG: hypothetical protein BWK77_07830 [Verrucomicrobia bacterium A1]|nr:MAG: hypothetical protein BWK77_07830 [Verrucomicrobia bacterium A1]
MNRGLVILLAALAAVRILTAVALWPSLRSPDHPWAWSNNDGYDRIAATWVETGIYGSAPGIPTATRTPAYPALLAAARILSGGHDSQPLATAIQILLSLATGWMIHRTARLFFSETASRIALALFILNPQAGLLALRCSTETLFCFLVTGFVFHIARLQRDARPRDAWLAAAWLGMALLTRPTPFLLPLVLAPAFIRQWRRDGRASRAWLHLAGAACLALAILSPWLARNAALGAGFPTLETWRGRSLFHGVHVTAKLDRFLSGQSTLTELDEEAGRIYTAWLCAYRHTAPGSRGPLARERWESDMGARLGAWAMTESPRLTATRTARNVLLAPFLQMTRRSTVALAAFNGPLLLLAFAGLRLAARSTPGGFLVLAPVVCALLYFWLLHALVWPQARYVLPGLLPFTIFAGHALAEFTAMRIANRR